MLSQIIPKLSYSLHTVTAPSINIRRYLNQQKGWQDDCKTVSQSLHRYGLVYAKDDRFDQGENEIFLDLMEKYYATRSYQFDQGLKNIDVVQSELPVGLKPPFIYKFNAYQEDKSLLKAPHLSMTPINPQPDPTWRFYWIVGSKNNAIPNDFNEFEKVMNTWGNNLKNCGLIISQMAAIGLNLEKDIFSSKINKGDQYFSPTGVDLLKSTRDKVLCSFHRDFDLFTIHGRSRYAGLYAWLNTGQKLKVAVPEGHMLVQGGKQLEWLTGGYIKAGFHQVIHDQYVQTRKQDAIRKGKWPWRVSSTLFCQAQLSQSLKPLQPFQSDEVLKKYPDITAYEYVQKELADLIHQ